MMFKGRHFDHSVILLCVRWYAIDWDRSSCSNAMRFRQGFSYNVHLRIR
jgi:transposase-like protein